MNAFWEDQIAEIEEMVNGMTEEDYDPQNDKHTYRRHTFRIENDGLLIWAMRKLAALQQQEKEIEDLAKQEIERIEEWKEKRLAGVERSQEYLRGHIERYAREQRMRDPKWKGSTPYGKVYFRRPPIKWEWEDDSALVAWLETSGHKDLLRVKKEPEKTEIKKRFLACDDGRVVDKDSGEVLPGVRVEAQDEKLYVEVAKK